MVIISYTLCIVLCAVVSSYIIYDSIEHHRTVPEDTVRSYARWKVDYKRLYHSPAEANHRLTVFHDQLMFIDRINREYGIKMISESQVIYSPMFTLNKYADLDREEFKARYAGATLLPDVEQSLSTYESINTSRVLPDSQSYKIQIRNQGQCGSCWVFSAILSTEKLHYDTTGQTVDLSHQELIDCDTGNNGCVGGAPERAY